MTSLPRTVAAPLRTAVLAVAPHGGQRRARANAAAALDALREWRDQPVTNIRTASAASTTANSRRRVASD